MAQKAGRLLGYKEIAEKMGVALNTVQILATKGKSGDPDFPERVTPPSMRSPGFDEADVDRYIKIRAARSSGRAGRPPSAQADRVELPPEVIQSISDRLKDSDIPTKEILSAAGISDQVYRNRLAGVTKWRSAELSAVAGKLEISVDELTAVPVKKRAPRARASSK